MPEGLETYSGWIRKGRAVAKGASASFYLVNDDRTSAVGLFDHTQTTELGAADRAATEGWSIVITADDWEALKAERTEARRGPRVKVRRPEAGGVAVWCGPDTDIIALLRHSGYTYDAPARYWVHPTKDPAAVAAAFEAGKIRGRHVRVTRDFAPGGIDA